LPLIVNVINVCKSPTSSSALAGRRTLGNPATFDYLPDSDYGSIDIVPTVSGTYEDLAPRAANVRRGRHAILVEAVSDLLATLTVRRREKDAERVRQLRQDSA
jgi:hypothetical protein